MSRPQTAPTMTIRPNIRHATNPSIVSSRRPGPMIAAIPVLLPNDWANASRDATVGKLVW